MADRVHPTSKPVAASANGATKTFAANGNPAFPATKAQLYGASRPAYRPQPHHRSHRHRRSCCCSCCLWTTITILILIFLAAAAGSVMYFIYRPHRPTFSISSLKITAFNVTSSSTLITNINLNITARNPNKNIVFYYDTTTVSLTTNDGVDVGGGTFPSFVHGGKNTTLLKASIKNNGKEIEDTSATKLRSELRSKNGLPLKIDLDTKVKVKMGVIKTPNVGIRVYCDGIKVTPATGKTPPKANTNGAKCKVDLRIKIWKWTL